MMYLVKTEALLRAKERAANAGIDADSFMGEFLDLSARKDINAAIHYAVFLTAAVWLEQSPTYQSLKQAENGVQFTQLLEVIASLRALQAAYDAANSLIIPPGFEAIALEQTAVTPIFSTRVLRTKVLF